MEENFYNKLTEFMDSKDIYLNENMSKHTSFKAGGNAKIFVKVYTYDILRKILELISKYNINYYILGNGTNVLFRDKEFNGIVIQIKFEQIEINGNIVTVGAGVKNAILSNKLLNEGLTGFEFASGIPGTIGGAIKMNAGAYGSEFKDIVKTVTFMQFNGEIKTIKNEECFFSYRNSIFFKMKVIILSATFELEYRNKEEIKSKINEYNQARREKQPIEYPSAGSTFKRGEDFITAKIIDECGLKGYRIGDAQVSEKHAGFIINKGNASATEIIKLIENVKKIVLEKTNKKIELEIEII